MECPSCWWPAIASDGFGFFEGSVWAETLAERTRDRASDGSRIIVDLLEFLGYEIRNLGIDRFVPPPGGPAPGQRFARVGSRCRSERSGERGSDRGRNGSLL